MGMRELLSAYGVAFTTSEESAQVSRGWIGTRCPFCSDASHHLGIPEVGAKASHCWRCGSHPIGETIALLLNVSVHDALGVLQRYDIATASPKAPERLVKIQPVRLPAPHTALTERGRKYLIGRGFDPDKLVREWHLRETGPIALLDNISYGHRLLIPVHWNGEFVSFTTRDITGRADRRYITCPKWRETIPNKHIVYRHMRRVAHEDKVIVVEGPADVWRLGPSAVATFGTAFTMHQVLALASIADAFIILFDNEPPAQEQAKQLATKLRVLGKAAALEIVDDDPGAMSQEDADYFVKMHIGRISDES